MSASDVIAAVALGISFLSAGLAIVSLVLSFRESTRRDEEIGHLRREAERREEELSLFRQQVAGQLDERLRQQAAHISVGERVPTGSSERAIDYAITVQNTGSYIARQIGVELLDDRGSVAGAGHVERALSPGESAVVTVSTPPPDRYRGPYQVFVTWHDGRGPNREARNVKVGRP